MTDDSDNDIKELLISLQGKRCYLKTKGGLNYKVNNLQVHDDTITFSDKFGFRVLMSIQEILQISEVRGNGD